MAASEPKRSLGGDQVLKRLRWSSLFVVGLIALCALMFFAPNLATPVAKLYYEDGFNKAVAAAFKEIPDSASACIYDDSQNIFVTSLDQLNLDRMIGKAVQDRIPNISLDGRQRDPHFRVLANGKTYYWSFHDAKFYAFPAGRWTLTGESARMCSAYMQSPQLYQETFRSLYGIAVSEENFCCGLDDD